MLYALRAPDFLAGFGVEAPDNPAIVHDVEIGSVGDRSRYIGTVLERPQPTRLSDVAVPARSKSLQRPHARRRVDNIVEDHRRSDHAIRSIFLRIETVPAPQL